MSLKRLVGAGALTLYAGVAGANSVSAIREYENQREIIFREFISDHVKNKGHLGIVPEYENTCRAMDYVNKGGYHLAVNLGIPTSLVASLGALYLLFGKRKEE